MSERIGTLRIEERLVPIERVWLADGKIMLQAHIPGPGRIAPGMMIMIYGADGQLVIRGVVPPDAGDLSIGAHDVFHFVYGMQPADHLSVGVAAAGQG